MKLLATTIASVSLLASASAFAETNPTIATPLTPDDIWAVAPR